MLKPWLLIYRGGWMPNTAEDFAFEVRPSKHNQVEGSEHRVVRSVGNSEVHRPLSVQRHHERRAAPIGRLD
jgi:hypothetical protein